MRKSTIILISLTAMVAVIAVTCGLAFSADAEKATAQVKEQPAAGCGTSCNTPASSQNPGKSLNLTEAQEKKLAEIDARYNEEARALREKLSAKTQELNRLIEDSKSSDSAIREKMHERAILLADLQLTGIFAERAKDRVYTPDQKDILSKSGNTGCSCGSGGAKPAATGGCGSSSSSCGG